MTGAHTYKTKLISLLILLQACLFSVYGQDQRKVDSLTDVIREAKHDTIIADAYLALAIIHEKVDPDTMIQFCELVLKIAENNQGHQDEKVTKYLLSTKAIAISNIGLVMLQRGALDNALAYVDSSIQLNMILGEKRDLGLGLFNSSIIYRQLGDTLMALEAIEKSLNIFTEIHYQRAIALIHNTMGLILTAQNKYDTALVHLNKALEIRKKLNDNMGIGVVHSNLGRLYSKQNRLKAAAVNFNKSLAGTSSNDAEKIPALPVFFE